MTDKILMAMSGGTKGLSRPCGMLEEGYCIVLAATPKGKDLVQMYGEDRFASEALADAVLWPPAGGLWVLECHIEEDTDGDVSDEDEEQHESGLRVESGDWREPTLEEIMALRAAQTKRATRSEITWSGASAWAFEGAFV